MKISQNVQPVTFQKTTGYVWLYMCDNARDKNSNMSMDIGSIICLGQCKWYQIRTQSLLLFSQLNSVLNVVNSVSRWIGKY